MDLLEKYYNKFNEDKRLLSRHGQVEFFVAMEYIKKIIGDRKGLDIIDIGAESTRPGAKPVSEEEQLEKLLPLLDKITLCLFFLFSASDFACFFILHRDFPFCASFCPRFAFPYRFSSFCITYILVSDASFSPYLKRKTDISSSFAAQYRG